MLLTSVKCNYRLAGGLRGCRYHTDDDGIVHDKLPLLC